MTTFQPPVKALFFDVFGTCVDWRKTVTDALWNRAQEALSSDAASVSGDIRDRASRFKYEDWGDVAQEWRKSYVKFTGSIAADPSIPYMTVDEHHLLALRDILTRRGLILQGKEDNSVADGSLWNGQQIEKLSLIWHYLDPWKDTVQGIRALNTKFQTITLSNGNVTLLEDMAQHAKMDFTHLYSAEMFHSYKPSPKVYLGGAERSGLKPEECMMVAAHMRDLKHAQKNGFRTLYVERPQEEDDPELLTEGIPDVWVKIDENGFVTAAERLGIAI